MKNYEYENWLESNYLSSDFTDEELDDLYKICNKNCHSYLKQTFHCIFHKNFL